MQAKTDLPQGIFHQLPNAVVPFAWCVPFVGYQTPVDERTSVSDDCEQDARNCSSDEAQNTVMDGEQVSIKEEDDEEDDVLCSLLSRYSDKVAREMVGGAGEMERVQEIEVDEHKYNTDTCDQVATRSSSPMTHTAQQSYECIHRHWKLRGCGNPSSREYFPTNSYLCRIYDKSLTSYTAYPGLVSNEHDHSTQNKRKSAATADAAFISDSLTTNTAHSPCQSNGAISQLLTKYRHIPPAGKSHECSMCHKTFGFPSALTKHKLSHGVATMYMCDMCKKVFSRFGDVHKHIRSHTDENPFRCDVCHRTFRLKRSLTMHRRVHTRKPPCVCYVCYKAFDESSKLDEHKCVHA